MRPLLAACLLTGSLGSIHAFSVFVVPLEQSLGASRGAISLIYSLALVFLTVAVLLGHRLYDCIAPPFLAAGAALAAGLGLLLAAFGSSLWAFYLGYGLLFGAANGLGYGFALFLVGRDDRHRKGLALGLVTATYAIGATVFAKLFGAIVASAGTDYALGTMGLVMVLVALSAALLLRGQARRMPAPPSDRVGGPAAVRQRALIAWMWLGYGLGAAAGLMAIGHAAGIVLAARGDAQAAVAGAMLIGIGNALGGVIAGWLADRWPVRILLAALPLLSAAALFSLSLEPQVTLAVSLLALIGFAYGAIIVVYPAAVAKRFGGQDFSRVYGQIFTAWGLAGLAAPWLAGALFDLSGSYRLALLLAGLGALLSAATAFAARQGAVEGRQPDLR